MLPLDFILFLQIIIFLFITPGTPRIVIISYLSGSQKGSGGTVTTSGGYYIHTFTSSGTFTA